MPTNFMYLQGTGKWATLSTPDGWGKYKISLYPNNEALDKIRDLQSKGLKNVLKKDEDGWFVTFSRPAEKEMRGKIVTFAPPEVFDSDGKTPLNSLVGNGSKVTVKLAVYPHNTPGGGKAIAARLEGVRVDHLVPYDKGQRDQEAVINDEPLF